MRSLERKKRLKIAITSMFSRRRRRSRARKEWICERRCQVSVSGVVYMYFRDCFALKPFRDYSLCSVCILPQSTFYSQSAFYTQSAFYPWSAVCSLHFTHSLHFTPGPQSAVCSPQSAVRSLHFTLTESSIGRQGGGHTLALQHGNQNYFLLVSC